MTCSNVLKDMSHHDDKGLLDDAMEIAAKTISEWWQAYLKQVVQLRMQLLEDINQKLKWDLKEAKELKQWLEKELKLKLQ